MRRGRAREGWRRRKRRKRNETLEGIINVKEKVKLRFLENIDENR